MLTNIVTLDPLVTGLPSPLTLYRGETNRITLGFATGVELGEDPETRYATDLQHVLQEPDQARSDDALYTVQRQITPIALREEIERRGLSYALTALRSGNIGNTQEWVRTRGHVNSLAMGATLTYPEIHEVLLGEAWLYLQDSTTEHPHSVAILPLFAGDKAVVAPGWASLLVNTGETPLVLGTWRMADCQTENAALVAHGGMAHFILRDTQDKPYVVVNNSYRAVPEPYFSAPKELPDFGLVHTEPLLAAFHHSPDYLRCLLRPQDFAEVWKTLYD